MTTKAIQFLLHLVSHSLGTVLAPLLFLCFISDITNKITSRIRFYADDVLLRIYHHYFTRGQPKATKRLTYPGRLGY